VYLTDKRYSYLLIYLLSILYVLDLNVLPPLYFLVSFCMERMVVIKLVRKTKLRGGVSTYRMDTTLCF